LRAELRGATAHLARHELALGLECPQQLAARRVDDGTEEAERHRRRRRHRAEPAVAHHLPRRQPLLGRHVQQPADQVADVG